MLCYKRQAYGGHLKIVQSSKILFANKPGAIIITMEAFQCHRHRGKVVKVVNCENKFLMMIFERERTRERKD